MDCLSKITRIEAPFCGVCGMPFISKAGDTHVCPQCLKANVPFEKARSAVYYDEGVTNIIHCFKYGGDMGLIAPLNSLLIHALRLLDEKGFDVAVPVPLHKKRLKHRGFNQSLLLARELKRESPFSVDYLNLRRIRHTLPQVNLKQDERVKNVKGAFEVKDGSFFKGKKVLLIDDVYTTGATIKECSKVLKKAGAQVYAITLARAASV